MMNSNNFAKQYSICKQTLTLDNFRKVRLSSDGYASYCKHCAKSKRAEKKSNEIVKGGGQSCFDSIHTSRAYRGATIQRI